MENKLTVDLLSIIHFDLLFQCINLVVTIRKVTMNKNKITISLCLISGLFFSVNSIAANTTGSLQTTASIESLCTLNSLNDINVPLPLTPPSNGSLTVSEVPTLTIKCNQNYPSNITYNVIGSAWGTYNFNSEHGEVFPTFTDSMISDNDGNILGLAYNNEVTNTPVGNIKQTDVKINLFVKYPLGQDNKPLYIAPGSYQWNYEVLVSY